MHATDQRAQPGMLPDQRACMAGTSMRKSKKLITSIDVNTIIYNGTALVNLSYPILSYLIIYFFLIRVKFKFVFMKFLGQNFATKSQILSETQLQGEILRIFEFSQHTKQYYFDLVLFLNIQRLLAKNFNNYYYICHGKSLKKFRRTARFLHVNARFCTPRTFNAGHCTLHHWHTSQVARSLHATARFQFASARGS